jgi:HTH-type transcriptional regulator/antitoxin HigA
MESIVRLITNEDGLDRAQAEMGRLLEKTDRTAADEDRLGVLGVLIRGYEDEHWTLEMPYPVCAIQSRMDDLGLQQADLLGEFGNKSTASLIMSRRRPLTLPVIRRLAARLTLPIAVLAQEYELAADSAPEDAPFPAIA